MNIAQNSCPETCSLRYRDGLSPWKHQTHLCHTQFNSHIRHWRWSCCAALCVPWWLIKGFLWWSQELHCVWVAYTQKSPSISADLPLTMALSLLQMRNSTIGFQPLLPIMTELQSPASTFSSAHLDPVCDKGPSIIVRKTSIMQHTMDTLYISCHH